MSKFKGLLNSECEQRLKGLLNYIEDGDLRRWILPDIKAFSIGLKQELAKLNCVTNPSVFEQVQIADYRNLDIKLICWTMCLFGSWIFMDLAVMFSSHSYFRCNR